MHKVSSGSFPPGLTVNSDAARIRELRPRRGRTGSISRSAAPVQTPVCPSARRTISSHQHQPRPGEAHDRAGGDRHPPRSGAPYSLQMTATVPDAKTWTVSSGTLPPGLALDAETGLISGTPTAAGQYDFQVLAKMNSDTRTDTKSLGDRRPRAGRDRRIGSLHGGSSGAGRGVGAVRGDAGRLGWHGHVHVDALERDPSGRPDAGRRRDRGNAHRSQAPTRSSRP